jgi:hypothetical protein
MADDFELSITIRAFDEASAVLSQLSAEIADEFAALSAEAIDAERSLSQALDSMIPNFSGLIEAAAAAGDGFAQFGNAAATLDAELVGLAQDAASVIETLAQLGSFSSGGSAGALGELQSFDLVSPGSGGGIQTPFGDVIDLFGQTAPSVGTGGSGGGGDLLALSRQQLDVMSRLLDVTKSAQGSGHVVQNNTFNGILDPGTIREQIIPELERSLSLGITRLGGF